MAPAADEKSDHGYHFPDLMHHEGLAVDFQGEPFCVVYYYGLLTDNKTFYYPCRRGVFEGFVDGIVVVFMSAFVTC